MFLNLCDLLEIVLGCTCFNGGRIFCFLTRDTLGVLDPLGKNLLNPHYGLFKYAWVYRGRIFCVLRRDDVLNMLDPLGNNLLFPYWDSVLEFM